MGDDFLLNDLLPGIAGQKPTDGNDIGNFARATRSIQPEGDKLRDLLDDFRERTGFVDVFKNAAAALFELRHAMFERGLHFPAGGECERLPMKPTIERPVSNSERD
jgi:hypothetical protein